jgi:hypothetical protein
VFEQTTSYKRQQRRRAIIAWGVGALAVVFFALSAIFGAGDRAEETEPPNAFGYTMSSAEYDALEPGIEKEEFFEEVENVGLPEDQIALSYRRLFPPPGEGVSCSFWEISDRLEEVARICFSDSDGHLVDKLEHGLEEEEFGVTA